MSHLVAIPDLLASAAADLAGVGSSVCAANVAAAGSTTALLAAAGDEVSAAIATLAFRPGAAVPGDQRSGGRLSRSIRAGVGWRRGCVWCRRAGRHFAATARRAGPAGRDQCA
ncbi:PE family protein [Mycobacterium ulcerans]|uniref:PE family protein n=1 Tax=Mycobacterium ulcerans TaxID=1809 RepID=A0ABY5TUC3_MYCUL|nr:PE family protein [Mycobacterium ulcerans]MEB3904846.1 PE family protein [Mycobacterium ulcerans]MEB3908881.1 PE family protein [Mycobacterium ulcerans]MEB3931447.1 PE family protein [Mycobacterium ulcerans]MEB3956069.1 PE family protein [Mycobacterium ulcerans]MEB3968943.1 PE family protein [Mycobacterium ulcerans]